MVKTNREIFNEIVRINYTGVQLCEAFLAAWLAERQGECWLSAVGNELVCAHLGTADASDDYRTASDKLNTLICWHIAVATDPKVNGGKALVSEETINNYKYIIRTCLTRMEVKRIPTADIEADMADLFEAAKEE